MTNRPLISLTDTDRYLETYPRNRLRSPLSTRVDFNAVCSRNKKPPLIIDPGVRYDYGETNKRTLGTAVTKGVLLETYNVEDTEGNTVEGEEEVLRQTDLLEQTTPTVWKV